MAKFFKWFGISIGVIFLIVVILGVLVVGIISKKAKENYMDKNMYCDDRKTVESFGNKRFAIEKGTRVGNEDKIIDGEKRYFLFDRSKNEDVDYDVKSYKKSGSYVYILGCEGYTRLDYETGEVIQSEDIDSFGEEDRKIFGSLKAGKGFIKK
ncbi:MAG: hypothetical protein IJI84_01830 [Clostridia bacterium]|nr:hypothetical protein [Clostridia bacterium]